MVRCPIINDNIEIGVCVTVVDVTEKMVKNTAISSDFYNVENWEDICKNCEYHNN